MITAVDTNVLLDLLIPDAPHSDGSEHALALAARAGGIVLSEAVYAEIAARFLSRDEVDAFLGDTGVRLEPSNPETLYVAGAAWSAYAGRRPAGLACPKCGSVQAVRCERCGASIRTRQHIVADFLIGAHAMVQAGRLLTRDRGFYATYFPQLTLAS